MGKTMDNDSEARITLRLPTALRHRLTDAAQASSRSMNGEIVFRLEDFDRLSAELEKTEALLTKREEALFTDRVELRNLRPELEEVRRRLDGYVREVADLRKIIDQQRLILKLSEYTRDTLERILEEAEEGRDATLKNILSNRAAKITPEQEEEVEKWVRLALGAGDPLSIPEQPTTAGRPRPIKESAPHRVPPKDDE
jgi:hypothetical protein